MPWDDFEAALEVDAMSSGAATNGQVPAADGSGGIDWEDPSGGGGGGGLATLAPEDVSDTAAIGTSARGAREDHEHRLATNDTLEFGSGGALSVSITDVIEHLTQRIRYYTSDSLDHSTGGSAAGQVYDTNRYPKNIYKIQADVRPDVPSIYKAGIYTVTSGNQIIAVLGQSEDSEEYPSGATAFVNFDLTATGETDLGIPLEGGERIAILIRRAGAGNNADTRLRRGGEATNSPQETYADAELDFVLDNHVVYTQEDPANGDNTDSHGDSIRGNIRIFYSVTIDHGSLIGDGNVSADHIDSGSAADGDVLTADGSGGAAFEAATGGGSFDLREDVTTAITAGNLAAADRFVASDESETGDPNRYVTAGNLIDSLFDVAADKVYTGAMAANDLVVLGDTSRSDGNRIRGILWSNFVASLPVADMDSESATDGDVATADGSGGIAWEAVPGGDGSDFDLDEDVTTPIGEGNIATQDRFVISDFSGAGDPNRWADLDDVIQGIWPALAGRVNHTGHPANADIVMIGDASMNDGLRMRRMLWPDFVGNLRVADMDSESATDGHVATADGLGGIAWETGSGSFDLHDDVTAEISGLNVVDRLLISDESVGGDPNRYVNLSHLMQGMWQALQDHTAFSGTPTNTDIVIMGDASQGSDRRMRRIAWPDFLGNLTVADMDSGSAANNTVPRADGSGGIDWEAIPSGSGSFDLYEDVST